MQRTLAAAFVAATLLLAACGPSATPTPGATSSGATTVPSEAPATAPPATGSASVGPTTVAPPAGTLPWPGTFAVEMTPGTYFTTPPFVIPMTVPMSEAGWYAGHINPTFIDLQRFDGVEVGSFPNRMIGFGWPENVRDSSGPVPAAGLTPAAAIDILTGRGSLKSGERAAVELLGLQGERIDLHSDLGNNPIFGTSDGDFGLGPELDMRLAVLPLGDGLLMVATLATADDLDDAWEQALAILGEVELVE